MQLKGIEAGKQSRHSNFVQLPSPWKRASDETHNTARANIQDGRCLWRIFSIIFIFCIYIFFVWAHVGVITVLWQHNSVLQSLKGALEDCFLNNVKHEKTSMALMSFRKMIKERLMWWCVCNISRVYLRKCCSVQYSNERQNKYTVLQVLSRSLQLSEFMAIEKYLYVLKMPWFDPIWLSKGRWLVVAYCIRWSKMFIAFAINKSGSKRAPCRICDAVMNINNSRPLLLRDDAAMIPVCSVLQSLFLWNSSKGTN